MDQKAIAVIIIGLIVVGIGVLSYSKYQQSTNPSPSPSPSAELIFNSDINKTPSSPPEKTIKQYKTFPGSLAPGELQNKKAVILTSKGKIEFELYPEATKAASNFIFLAKEGFYEGIVFHRVEPGFVVQTGDPTGTGRGGPGYKFEDEPVTKQYSKGIVAMANSGPNTNGSQFFIMLENKPLPPQYTIFGKVFNGQEVVDQIRVGDIMEKVTIENLPAR